MNLPRIGVVGAGAWGTALAALAAALGREALLWARNPRLAETLSARRENAEYLPGIPLPDSLAVTARLADLSACDALLLAMPAQSLREYAIRIRAEVGASMPLVLTAKGIEIATGGLLSEVLAQELPQAPLAVLSGPTFAKEVALGLPAAATLASRDAQLAQSLSDRLGRPTFRPYVSDDVVGVQIGGALKNVMAIACGVVMGRRLGDNARAALITRGLAEMVRLGLALGGRAETLMGLSGLGDLVLTCAGLQSRNLSLGMALGEGVALEEYLRGRHSVAEGMFTARAVQALAARLGVDLPIAQAVHAILHEKADIGSTIAGLLARPFRAEQEGSGRMQESR